MNFLLNKIDTDIRRKVYDKTKDGKVHKKEKINIYKDSDKNKERNFKDLIEEKQGKKIIVNAVKEQEVDIEIRAEKDSDTIKSLNGTFIDIRK